MKEEKCIILDFLSSGYSDRRHSEPIAQAVGYDYFSLLEVVPKEGVQLKSEQVVNLHDRDNDVKFIRSWLEYRDLTGYAKNVLPEAVTKIVIENEARFVAFFNTSRMLTPRMHQIQLLPGIGKKHLLDILDERKKKPFESLADLAQRVKLFPEPRKMIEKRVMNELMGTEKHYIFVAPKRKEY
ncbi:MAG: DUF655 domain-containing protein [Candidatus Aenigmatarchaeota archaeon]